MNFGPAFMMMISLPRHAGCRGYLKNENDEVKISTWLLVFIALFVFIPFTIVAIAEMLRG